LLEAFGGHQITPSFDNARSAEETGRIPKEIVMRWRTGCRLTGKSAIQIRAHKNLRKMAIYLFFGAGIDDAPLFATKLNMPHGGILSREKSDVA
jgi:hypothetical protein